MVKQEQKTEPKITATDSYKDRASIGPDSSLLITHAVLDDQRVFTCMVVSMNNLNEYPVEVEVHSEYSFLNIHTYIHNNYNYYNNKSPTGRNKINIVFFFSEIALYSVYTVHNIQL